MNRDGEAYTLPQIYDRMLVTWYYHMITSLIREQDAQACTVCVLVQLNIMNLLIKIHIFSENLWLTTNSFPSVSEQLLQTFC